MTKNQTKTMVFATLDILQLKKWWLSKYLPDKFLYLRAKHSNGYIEEKLGINIWSSILQMKTKSCKKIYKDVWSAIKNNINTINIDEGDYEKDFMKIKFNSDDDLPLNKPLKFHAMTIIIRSAFEEDGKLYLQVYLDDALYELSI